MQWMKFATMEDGVKGYFDFINISNYANLKGVTDPRTYLENIKADGYATSLKYVDNLMAVIEKYNLTQYDEKGVNELIIAIDAGHGLTTSGKRCMKALDANETREWWLNNRIADRLEVLLASYGCKIIRIDDTTGVKDISLADRVAKANNGNADIYISIHHNAGAGGGNSGGTEVYYYSSKAERHTQATALYNALINYTGLKGNRSTPVKKYAFYVVKNTKMPAFLIENGYMDSKIDTPIILTSGHAEKTAQAILRFLIEQFGLKQTVKEPAPTEKPGTIYRVQVGAYSVRANAEAMQKKLKASGYDATIVQV
jgi:N-acetylmuramoyl-L-alanine amidase